MAWHKKYADADIGYAAQNLILEPTGFTNYSTKGKEYTGWKTQKPIALLERIILASSNSGDLVLDPFCGCATACIAAEMLGRDWIGIGIVPQAAEVLRDRAKRELQLPLEDGSEQAWEDWSMSMRSEAVAPRRNDLTLLSPLDPASEKRFLYASQQRRCNGCQYELPFHVLTVDHIQPRSRGGLDSVGNLQLMCHTCNAIKGDRDMAYLRQRLGELGILQG